MSMPQVFEQSVVDLGVDRRRGVLCHLRVVLLVRRQCRLLGHPVRDDRDEGADQDMPAGIPGGLYSRLIGSFSLIYEPNLGTS